MPYIDKTKTLLGILDDQQDKVLSTIQELTVAQFQTLTGAIIVPSDLSWVIVEVMVKRYNRLGSEGLTSQSAEGLSMTFDSSDFEAYASILAKRFKPARKSGVKFI